MSKPSIAKKENALVSVESHPLAFLKRLRYWGWILLVSTAPLLILLQVFCKPKPVAARPTPEPEVVAPPLPEPNWPELELKGFVYNGSRSTVVLNGRTLFIGDRVDGVEVVNIEKWVVTVRFANEKRTIQMTR